MEEQDQPVASKVRKPRCKNCGKKLSKQGSFCPGCGQRDFDGRIRLRDVLGKFFAIFTHLNNKFIRMCRELFIPARVTQHYFEGKIKRYPHPVQFFFIVMFFFLLMFSKQFDDANFNMTGGTITVGGEETYQLKNAKRIKESALFEAIEHCVIAREHRAAFDSLPPELRTPEVRRALDSVVQIVEGPWEDATRYFLSLAKENGQSLDTITINFIFLGVLISTADLVNLTPDSIIQKYGFDEWEEKTAVRQGIKSLRDPKGLIHRYVASLGWTILVLITLMAFVLRLLYWQRGGFYVEHFIFLMHQQAGAFLMLTLAMVINDYVISLQWVWVPVLAWQGIFLLLAMKRFYGEKWGWTLVKWIVFFGCYLFGLLALFLATLLVVFVVF